MLKHKIAIVMKNFTRKRNMHVYH